MRALDSCRVLDLGIITAGAATAAVLADFGAEVIKVESPTYRDPFRRWLSARPADAAQDLPPFFLATNRNKLGISLDLKDPRGRDAFLRLVANSDVVVENFRRGVMENLNLSFSTLRGVNPNIILASISSQGESGPEAGYVSYGSTLEAVGGLAWITGYDQGEPRVTGVEFNYPDQVVALFASSMIVTAWRSRQQGGGGAHLDISQRELTSYLIGESFVASGAGIDTGRMGNRQPPHILQDCFASSDGHWLALTVDRKNLADLSALVESALESRDSSETSSVVAAWISSQPLDSALTALQAHGIAAAAVVNGGQVLGQKGLSWFHGLQHSPSGSIVKGFGMQFDRDPMTIDCDAPTIGADTQQVLSRVGGMSAQEIEALQLAGVIELPAAPTPQESVNV